MTERLFEICIRTVNEVDQRLQKLGPIPPEAHDPDDVRVQAVLLSIPAVVSGKPFDAKEVHRVACMATLSHRFDDIVDDSYTNVLRGMPRNDIEQLLSPKHAERGFEVLY